jgi:hypothetical protein
MRETMNAGGVQAPDAKPLPPEPTADKNVGTYCMTDQTGKFNGSGQAIATTTIDGGLSYSLSLDGTLWGRSRDSSLFQHGVQLMVVTAGPSPGDIAISYYSGSGPIDPLPTGVWMGTQSGVDIPPG